MTVVICEYQLDDNAWPKGTRLYFDDKYAIPHGWVTLGPSNLPVLPALQVPSDVPLGSVPDNYGASIQGKRLTPEGQRMKDEWDHLYKAKGCTCHDGLVCAHCAHPGHPYSLENNTKLWEDIPAPSRADKIMEAIRQMAGKS